jgi:hypothetical protein
MTYLLTAYDPETAFEPRQVEFVKPVSSGERSDYFWANVSPSFEEGYWRVPSYPMDIVFLAARREGASLRRVTGPTHVYLCAPKLQENILADRIERDDLVILNWALITPVQVENKS